MSMKSRLQTVADVLGHYPFKMKRITTDNYKTKRGLWWIDTNKGKKLLKKMNISKDRLDFLLDLMPQLTARGIALPKVVLNQQGKPFVEMDGAYFLLYEVLKTKPVDLTGESGLATIVEGLAAFHKCTKGFKPEHQDCQWNRLGCWLQLYRQRIMKLGNLTDHLQKHCSPILVGLLLMEAPYFTECARKALLRLETSKYQDWIEEVRSLGGLCHNAFSGENLGLISGQQLYLQHIDYITYDLPARDLANTLNMIMKVKGKWSMEMLTKLLIRYQQVNPLTAVQYEVLFADLAFPHMFYEFYSSLQSNRDWSNQKYLVKLNKIIDLEKTKDQVLLSKDSIIIDIVAINSTV